MSFLEGLKTCNTEKVQSVCVCVYIYMYVCAFLFLDRIYIYMCEAPGSFPLLLVSPRHKVPSLRRSFGRRRKRPLLPLFWGLRWKPEPLQKEPYTYIHTYIHMHVHVHLHLHLHMHIIYIYIYIYILICICLHIHTPANYACYEACRITGCGGVV